MIKSQSISTSLLSTDSIGLDGKFILNGYKAHHFFDKSKLFSAHVLGNESLLVCYFPLYRIDNIADVTMITDDGYCAD